MKYSWHFGSKIEPQMNHNEKDCLKRKMEIPTNENSSVSTSTKKIKRYRSAFTTEQVNYLEMEFKKFAYIGSIRRRELSAFLSIPERAIKIWFQNRRMKEKKDVIKVYDDDQKHLQIEKSSNDIITEHLINDCQLSTNHRDTISSNAEDSINEANECTNNVIDMSTKPIVPQFITNFNCNTVKPTNKQDPIQQIKKDDSCVRIDSSKFSAEPLKKYNEGYDYATKLKNEVVTVPLDKNKPIDDRHHVSSSSQNEFSESHIPTAIFPQDLTSKANLQILNSTSTTSANTSTSNIINNTHLPTNFTSSSIETPLYFNSVYAQPYFPPRNVMWKPMNATPIMSTGLPGVFGNNIGTSNVTGLPGVSILPSHIMQTEQLQVRMVKPKCNCDCHENTTNNMVLQNTSAIPQLQYVITALPFQSEPTLNN